MSAGLCGEIDRRKNMRVNIENCNNTGDPSAKEWVLGELVRNLKELRDRTDAGDMKALDEFFGLFVFNDDRDRKKVGAGGTAKKCEHKNRECTYESDDGEFERWQCKDCGERWGVEIAQ